MQITCVFNNSVIGSTKQGNPAIRAGASLDPYTTVKLIFTNDSKVSAIGGNGGNAFIRNDNNGIDATTTSATSGGDVYQSDGIATEIYLNYGTVDTYVTDCYMYAPGGGGASAAIASRARDGNASATAAAAASGGGGSGIPGGIAGVTTKASGSEGNIVNGKNGTFNAGGPLALATHSGYGTVYNPQGPDDTASLSVSSISGAGGFSLTGLAATASTNVSSGSLTTEEKSLGATGQAGGAIKGANVTVYNLSASSSRFRDGNSDPYTLVSA